MRTYPFHHSSPSAHTPLRSILIWSLLNFFFSSSFFQNKGAVAGVFSVVGLIGLVLLIALITNVIRRRRERKFDKELYIATQEAAATAPKINFLDDEDDEPKRNGYSDASHGTYGQPPMQAYSMRHMGGHVDEYDPGAAGIGLPRGGYPLDDGRPLYPQFAMPRDAMAPYDSYADGPFGRGNMALSSAAAAGLPYSRSPPPRDPTNLGRSKSGSTIATHPSHPSNPSTPSHTSHYPQPYSVGQTVAPPSLPNPYTEEHPTPPRKEPVVESADDAAYGGLGYVEDDDVEEEAPKRVLKVRYSFYFVSQSTLWLMSFCLFRLRMKVDQRTMHFDQAFFSFLFILSFISY